MAALATAQLAAALQGWAPLGTWSLMALEAMTAALAVGLAEQPAWRTQRSGQPLFNERMGVHTPKGGLRWLLASTVPQFDDQGRPAGVITCFIDATERHALQDRLPSAARTDALTRLPNREAVMDRLARAIDHAQRHAGYGFAVLFMDFDRFKQVNDTLGHAAGDELLRQIAGRLQQALRPGDALGRVTPGESVAARLGGDEFVVVLEGVRDEATVRAITERLLADLREPYTVAHHPVQSSASIGVVLWQGQDLGPEEILRNADTAMYEAKRAGRNRCVIFDDPMHDRVVHALAVQTDLRQALARDELFLVYQPVVDLASQQLLGVEALVRWRHPTRGLLLPGEFIAVAEECGLIDALGERVLQLACLHLLPVDTVKIDRSFITHAETVEYHRVLIEATIRVARTLDMRTVAEGIETPGQAALMRQLRCDDGQGYLYGRPMAPTDLAAWLDRGTVDLALA